MWFVLVLRIHADYKKVWGSFLWQKLVPAPSGRRNRGLAHIDDGICLNVVHIGVPEPQLFAASLGGAHDPCGDCVLKREGASDGYHKLSRSQLRGMAKQQDWQLSLRAQRQAGIAILRLTS